MEQLIKKFGVNLEKCKQRDERIAAMFAAAGSRIDPFVRSGRAGKRIFIEDIIRCLDS